MSRHLITIGVRVVTVGLSVLVTLGLLEFALRLGTSLVPESARIYAKRQNEKSWRVGTLPDSYIGYLFPPNVERRVEHGEVAFTYRTDAFGFLNSRPWPDRAEIVALGDSMAFGYGADHEEAWTSIVDQALTSGRPAAPRNNICAFMRCTVASCDQGSYL